MKNIVTGFLTKVSIIVWFRIVTEITELNVIRVKRFTVPNLKYDLYAVYGGRIPFGVRTDSGALFVKEPLDYEKV